MASVEYKTTPEEKGGAENGEGTSHKPTVSGGSVAGSPSIFQSIQSTIFVSTQARKEPVSEQQQHDDYFEQFLKKLYFPFLQKYSAHVCCLWFCIFIVIIIYGPSFLSKTESDLDLPTDTPSYKAIAAYQENYPTRSTIPSIFIVYHLENTNNYKTIINSYTQNVASLLTTYVSSRTSELSGVSGYWELINYPAYTLIANSAVSDNNRTMISTVSFQKEFSTELDVIIDALLEFAEEHTSSDVSVMCTGTLPLFHEMSIATEENFVMIDATVLPIAIVILATQVKSYRHMVVAFCNLVCTILLAFAVLVPITEEIAINPFAPSIMMSLGIAICFDYSLFMLTRFAEEMKAGKSTAEAVYFSLSAAGHVVLLSGATLFFTFALLIAFPQNFLKSVGWGCGAVVLSAVICNFTITPSLLLSMRCLSRFEPFPTKTSLCCVICEGSDEDFPTHRDLTCSAKDSKPVVTNQSGVELYAIPERNMVAKQPKQVDVSLDSGSMPAGEGQKAAQVPGSSMEPGLWYNLRSKVLNPKIFPRSLWFHVTYFFTRHALVTFLVVMGVTAPFVYRFTQMAPTSDDALIYLRESQSLEGLNYMKESFPLGSLDPYLIIMKTGVTYGTLSSEYFAIEEGLIRDIFSSQYPTFIDTTSVRALSYYNGEYVDLATAMQYLNSTSTLGKSTVGSSYRLEVGSLMNSIYSTSMIYIETVINPNSNAAVPFINSLRSLIDSLTASTSFTNGSFGAYLFGGYTTTYDVQQALFELVPAMIGATVAVVLFIVGASFGSVFVALRLAATVVISLAWTYGLMVMVYQPGPDQAAFAVLTPSVMESTGIYWIIPVMSFSILVGLALDYDIFLMSRVVEFRREGWSDQASISLAIEKTGTIITAAGVIMSISFAGLLLPKSTVLNQYGFALFIGVAFDTFVVRTVVVPVIFSVMNVNWLFPRAKDVNWWPREMPPIRLTHEQETEALFTGYWDINLYLQDKQAAAAAASELVVKEV